MLEQIYDYFIAIMEPFTETLLERFPGLVIYDNSGLLDIAYQLYNKFSSKATESMRFCIEDVQKILNRDYARVMSDLESVSILQMPFEQIGLKYMSFCNHNGETCNFSFFDQSQKDTLFNVVSGSGVDDPVLKLTGKPADNLYCFVAESVFQKLKSRHLTTGRFSRLPDHAKMEGLLFNAIISNLTVQFVNDPGTIRHFFKTTVSPVDIYYLTGYDDFISAISFISTSAEVPFDTSEGLAVTQPPKRFTGVTWISESAAKLNFDNEVTTVIRMSEPSPKEPYTPIQVEISIQIEYPPAIDFVSLPDDKTIYYIVNDLPHL